MTGIEPSVIMAIAGLAGTAATLAKDAPKPPKIPPPLPPPQAPQETAAGFGKPPGLESLQQRAARAGTGQLRIPSGLIEPNPNGSGLFLNTPK